MIIERSYAKSNRTKRNYGNMEAKIAFIAAVTNLSNASSSIWINFIEMGKISINMTILSFNVRWLNKNGNQQILHSHSHPRLLSIQSVYHYILPFCLPFWYCIFPLFVKLLAIEWNWPCRNMKIISKIYDNFFLVKRGSKIL